MQKKFDIDYSAAVQTPHQKWAQPYAGGRLKAFFVPNIVFGREVIELAQRFDIDYETVSIDRNWDVNKWGLGDFYDQRGGIWDFDVMYENLQTALCSDTWYDLLVIPGVNGWGFFPDEVKKAVLSRVEKGAGLIINRPVHGFDLPKDDALLALSPLLPEFEEPFTPDGYAKIDYSLLQNEQWRTHGHYITNGIPFELFDCMRLGIYPYTLADGAALILDSAEGSPIGAVKTYGKGRVAAFGYIPTCFLPDIYDKDLALENGCFGSVTLAASYPEKNVRFDEKEYFYAMFGRAMLWAAGKEPSVTIDGVSVSGMSVTVDSKADEIGYSVKNVYGQALASGAGGTFDLPACAADGGTFRVEVFAIENGKTADFHTVTASFDKAASIVSVTPIVGESVLPGGEFACEVAYTGGAAALVCGVYDDFENLLQEDTVAIDGAGTHTVRYTAVPQKALNIRVVAEIRRGALVIDRAESKRVIVVPTMRAIDDFEAFLSPTFRGRPEFLRFTGELFREIGITGLYPGDSRMVMSSGAEGLGVYWYKRAGYVERKENYLQTGDKQYLHRKPCLSDPAFWAENAAKIAKTVGAGKKFGPLSYFANDEGSLTCYSDEFELCFCPHCMKDMREWLQQEYPSLSALNKAWAASFASWDEVEPDTFEEAARKNNFAGWGAHRLFMELVFTGAYEKINALVKAEDPEARIRMSGCQVSSPYTGCDYHLLHKHVGYFEAYTGGNQVEFHRSFTKPGTIIGGWTGYGVKGINARRQIWERVLHGFTLQSVFWCASNVNPDFTFPQSAKDLGRIFKEIRREGIGKLLLHTTKRDHLGIAIHYSMPSVHGSYALNYEKKFTDNRNGWVTLLEACGYQYNFLATQQIEAGALAEASVLILPFSVAVTDAEAAEIRKFVENGGFLLGDCMTGVMDKYCGWREGGCFDDLFGITRHSALMRPFYTDQELMKNKKFTRFPIPDGMDASGLEFAQHNVRAVNKDDAGYLQDFSNAVPAVVAGESGKGKSVYLNFALDNYAAMDKAGEGQGVRDLLTAILDYAGVEKFMSIYTPDGVLAQAGLETVYYSDGDARYVGILRQFYGSGKRGHDGLEIGGVHEERGEEMDAVIKLPRKAHVYDIREKRYLGYADSFKSKLEEGNVRLLSVLPEAVAAVKIDLPASVKGGEAFTLGIGIDKNGAAYTSVAAVNFTSPSGKYGFLYAKNVHVTDAAALEYRFPLNAEPGDWVITVKDVASGITASKTITVHAS